MTSNNSERQTIIDGINAFVNNEIESGETFDTHAVIYYLLNTQPFATVANDYLNRVGDGVFAANDIKPLTYTGVLRIVHRKHKSINRCGAYSLNTVWEKI